MALSRRNSPTPRKARSTRQPRRAKPPPARDSLEAAFAAALDNFTDGKAAVAVSGGSDSLALMHLLARHARVPPVVLTVDHGLRAGSAKDARKVLAWAKAAGLKAHRLVWKGAKPGSGIEAAAREARYRLMGAWLARNGIATLFVAHTQDDQAETFLLRLARGSGLDGLAAMRPLAPWPLADFPGLTVARPLLAISRADLRAWLTRRGQEWLDDPMNDDPRFDRVRMRRAAGALKEAGLTPARIADAARHLARAREALEAATEAVLLRACRPARGTERPQEKCETVFRPGPRPGKEGILLDSVALAAAPRELGLRALAALLMQVGEQPYRPRFEALERLFARIAGGTLGGGATLHGCRIAPAKAEMRIFGPKTLTIAREASPRSSGRGGKVTA